MLEIAVIQSGFTRKLQLAFAAMLLVTLVIAWYFYDSARWFSSDTRQLARASQQLADYEVIARQTWQSLQHMEEVVRQGAGGAGLEHDAAGLAVRAALERIESSADSPGEGGAPAGISVDFPELAQASDEIFQFLDRIDAALLAGQPERLQGELSRLDSSGVVSRFRTLIDAAISQQRLALEDQGAEAVSLSNYIVQILPMVMLLLVLLTIAVAWRFSRRLSSSLGSLRTAAEEFRSGELGHRVPPLEEREFQRLGDAFNEMAAELAEKAGQLREINAGLEATVEERTQALRQSNEKLALVDEHRRKLLAEISHEFRTPLTVMRGESEIALRAKNPSVAVMQDAFRRILDTADHATGLVEDLLFIVRADAGEPRLSMQAVDIPELVHAVCEEFRAKATGKSLEIYCEVPEGGPPLEGDPRRLRQVFAILLDNALRYSNPGDSVEVCARAGDGEWQVVVRDQGIGLSDEEAAQAFERFFRGRAAQSHADQGTGLGLPVAKAIVLAHSGSIELRSGAERGAVATVTLPMGKPGTGDVLTEESES